MNSITSSPAPELQLCPQCQAHVPIIPLYITWCDQCGWNAQPKQPPIPRTLFEQAYAKLGRYAGTQLSDTLAEAGNTSRFSVTRLLAVVVALFVYAVGLAFILTGITLIARSNWNLIVIALGLLCFGITWIARPRFGRMPEQPGQFPALEAVTRRIAHQLGLKRTPTIVITSTFNASFSHVGIRRQPVMKLGLPLFAILSAEERVALIAHELAHSVNGDLSRSFVVGSAVHSLAEWHQLCQPDLLSRQVRRYSNGSLRGFLGYGGGQFALIIMRCLSFLPWLGVVMLSHLLWRDSQRAEYLADVLAAKASGTANMLGLLEKLHYSDTVQQSIQRLVLSVPAHQVAKLLLIDVLRADVAKLPQRELERIRRIEMDAGSQLDATHPPTVYRVRALNAHGGGTAVVTISPEEQVQIDQELRRVEGRVLRELSDTYRSRLYY